MTSEELQKLTETMDRLWGIRQRAWANWADVLPEFANTSLSAANIVIRRHWHAGESRAPNPAELMAGINDYESNRASYRKIDPANCTNNNGRPHPLGDDFGYCTQCGMEGLVYNWGKCHHLEVDNFGRCFACDSTPIDRQQGADLRSVSAWDQNADVTAGQIF